MAAFINALGEEGSLDECRHWVRKLRDEKGRQVLDKGTLCMDKPECIQELVDLFYNKKEKE